MRLDLDAPEFTQKDAAAWTRADEKSINNYVHFGYASPAAVSRGRRMFTARQLVKIELIARLSELFKIPPSVGSQIAERFSHHRGVELAAALETDRPGLMGDLQAMATIKRDGDQVEIVEPGSDPDEIMIVVPVWAFARGVLGQIPADKARSDAAGVGVENVQTV